MTANYDANGNILNQSPSPSADAAGTAYVSDAVGNRADLHSTDSIAGRIHALNDHIHSAAKVYPTLANPVQLVAGTGAIWTLGSFVEVVPANAIQSSFDIHWINAEAMSADVTYEIVLYAVEVEIGRTRITRTANQTKHDGKAFMTPLVPANTQIKAKVASSADNADTVSIALDYHTY